jgi:membrane protein implicated in regulation of membrane protease activity
MPRPPAPERPARTEGRPVPYVLALLMLALGAAAVVAGGADDSPGLQAIGVLLAAGAVTLVVRTVRRRRGTRPTAP